MSEAPRSDAAAAPPSALAQALAGLGADTLLALAVALQSDAADGGFAVGRARHLAGILAGMDLAPEARCELATAAVLALDDAAPAVAELLALWLGPRAEVPARLGRARAEAWVREAASSLEIEVMLMACFNALPRRRRVAFLAAAQAFQERERG